VCLFLTRTLQDATPPVSGGVFVCGPLQRLFSRRRLSFGPLHRVPPFPFYIASLFIHHYIVEEDVMSQVSQVSNASVVLQATRPAGMRETVINAREAGVDGVEIIGLRGTEGIQNLAEHGISLTEDANGKHVSLEEGSGWRLDQTQSYTVGGQEYAHLVSDDAEPLVLKLLVESSF
jgi:hypothetical protein